MAEQIVKEILWTDTAKITFSKIVRYLQEEWSEKEAGNFINTTNALLATLQQHPEMCRPSGKRKNVRIAILDKHTQLVYHYKPRKKQIEVLLFWGMKQNPRRFKY
jgi:plasmid stabilization system protein ParE